MLDWLGPDGDQLRIAFTKVFGSRYEAVGSQALHIGGLSDGRKGVQWHVGMDPRDGTRFAGVRLEGLQYDGWPVARLIEREIKSGTLVDLVRENPALADVDTQWRREYWLKQSRPTIEERFIEPTPLQLGELTPEGWRQAVVAAGACLDGKKRRRGRGTQTVTLASGEQVSGPVSPHLNFQVTADADTSWEDFFRATKERLDPLHKWAVKRSTDPISF